jgi:hypothetical protein
LTAQTSALCVCLAHPAHPRYVSCAKRYNFLDTSRAAPASHLLLAAHALQAVLTIKKRQRQQHSSSTEDSDAALLKIFGAIAAAPLTHPLPADWLFHNSSDAPDAWAQLFAALLSGADSVPRLLQQLVTIRFGSASATIADFADFWWNSAPILMQMSAGDRSNTQHSSSSQPAAAASEAEPRRRYICRSTQLHFVWPSHCYSDLLLSWSGASSEVKFPFFVVLLCSGTKLPLCLQTFHSAAAIDDFSGQWRAFRTCPLSSVALGVQPLLQQLLVCNAHQIIGGKPSARGLLPWIACLLVFAQQVL